MRAGYAVALIVPSTTDSIVDGVQIKAVPLARQRLWRMTVTVWRVYRRALQENADIYHFHDPELIPAGLLLRLRGHRVIYGIHEDGPADVYSKYYLPRWLRPPIAYLLRALENATCPRFSALVAATSAIGERCRGLNKQTAVVHNYPDLREFDSVAPLPQASRPLCVAYLGSINPARGIRELLQAMALLPDTLASRLVLAGKFAQPGLAEELAGLRGWRRVDWLGFLDRKAVIATLRRVRAGVVLYRPEPNHVCAEPYKLFEYMAAGVPVVAADFPLWRSIIEESGAGLLVDPLDPAAIAKAIEFVSMHPDECEAMGQRGRRAAIDHYNWNLEERTLLQLYGDLLGGGSNPRV